MKNIVFIENPQEKFDEIEKLISIVFNGFMATAMDYGYHINSTFIKTEEGKKSIYELRDNINYRLNSAKLHFYLMLSRQIEIERRFKGMLEKDPTVFNGFIMGNPHFEFAADEIMSIYDSVIFHLSSSFDYVAMLMQFVFGKNPESKLQWITLAKHSYSNTSEFSKRGFTENIKSVDRNFVSKFNDYRAELIHRKKSSSFTNLTWELKSGRVKTQYKCSDKIKSNFKKIIDKEKNYCVTYITYLAIRESVLNIGKVLEGINNEFRENYHPHSPIMSKGGFQIISMNPETKIAESPALSYWKKFMEYKNVC
tara:strand:+ start:38 stop:967 length:930 start_codon:yes stop_codon:yes gene_type:complete